MKNSIAENIRYYRKQLNMTQAQLGAIFGGGASLISNYENGYSIPDINVLYKLAKIFDITIDELVEWEDDDSDGIY